jgi:Zn-dependent protease
MIDWFSKIQMLSVALLPILFAITLHEAAHGWVAFKLGDPTAKLLGRVTLNPLKHIDLIGTVIIPIMMYISTGFVFGYAKPVPVNYQGLRDPKRDMVWVAAAGPGTNLLLAIGCGFLFRTLNSLPMIQGDPLMWLIYPLKLMMLEGVKWNVLLGVFNLIPIPPLDGGRVLVGLLPPRQSYAYSRIEPFGFMIILAFMLFDPLHIMRGVIYPLIQLIATLIAGFNPFFYRI